MHKSASFTGGHTLPTTRMSVYQLFPGLDSLATAQFPEKPCVLGNEAPSMTGVTGQAREYYKKFYMPASCDTAVIAFRKWYHTMAGDGVTYAPGTSMDLPPLEGDRSKLLDR
eukprot:scaffold12714_cov38-Prasinocladus_malaysianus.AAC.1